MKFRFFDLEITIRKEYMVIAFLMLIIILALWGWYLRDNQVEVFRIDEENAKQVTQEKGNNTRNENLKQTDIVLEDASKGTSKANPKEMLTEEVPAMPININIADKDMLMELHGIGEVKSDAIIEYREQNGPFKSIEEIMNVKGIGEATFSKLKDRIVVGTEGRKPLKTDLLK